MADNVTVSQGIGTTMATNDISGVHYPRQKVGFGAPGSFSDVSAATPMPVEVVGTSSNIINGVFPGSTTVPYGLTTTLISVTPIAAIQSKFLVVGGDSDGIFQLSIGGVSFGKFRISWSKRTIGIPLGPIQVNGGTQIIVSVTCQSQSGNPGEYEGYVYY